MASIIAALLVLVGYETDHARVRVPPGLRYELAPGAALKEVPFSDIHGWAGGSGVMIRDGERPGTIDGGKFSIISRIHVSCWLPDSKESRWTARLIMNISSASWMKCGNDILMHIDSAQCTWQQLCELGKVLPFCAP